ncbi:MAG: hypothetical protein V1887_00955 [Candidatus Aenigmatarchaeota archaeon]
MKASISMPMEVLVAIIIAVVIIIIAAIMLGFIPGLENSQVITGYYNSCCSSYMIEGNCDSDTPNQGFVCVIGKEFDSDGNPDGQMLLSLLASKAGTTVDRCCNR